MSIRGLAFNLTFLLTLLICTQGFSQTGDERWRFYFGGGLNEYEGEAGDELFRFDDGPAFRMAIKYYLNSSLDLELGGSFGELDYGSFDDIIFDGDLNFQYKFNNGYILREDARIAPFLNAGIGFFGYDQDHRTELMAPLGAGLRVHLTEGLDIQYLGAYKRAFDHDFSYLQHTIGLTVNLEGSNDMKWSDRDSDFDGITDAIEMESNKKRNAVDTDGDEIPNYLDTDSDNDGMLDGVEVGENALMPVDTDGDGIADYKDVDSDGDGLGDQLEAGSFPLLPRDSDFDSIPDYRDIDSDNDSIGDQIEATIEGILEDTDGDGIPDYLDTDSDGDSITDNLEAGSDPSQPTDTDNDGVPDYRATDADGDGISDTEDLCRLVPGTASSKGCPFLDQDSDGVEDKDDRCPELAGIAENNGCPEIKEEVKQILSEALEGIKFQSGKAVILTSSYPILDKVAGVMKNNPQYKLKISGHTDNTGNPDRNMDLSQRRAEAARDYLIGKDLEEARVVGTTGFGVTKPIADNSTKAGRALNRRVEFEIVF